MSSIGYGQTFQLVTRTPTVTYYNTTGRPIALYLICALGTSLTQININGGGALTIAGNGTGATQVATFILQPGDSYAMANSGTNTYAAYELR
jgi:hypothetical protein